MMQKNKTFYTLLTSAIIGIVLLGVVYWLNKLYQNPNGFLQFSQTVFCSIAYLQLFSLGICWIFGLENYFGEKEMCALNWILAGFAVFFSVGFLGELLSIYGVFDSFYSKSYLEFRDEAFSKTHIKDFLIKTSLVYLVRSSIVLLFFIPKIRKNTTWTIAICTLIISWYLVKWYLVLLPIYTTPQG